MPAGGDERLPRDLAAEDPLQRLLRPPPAEDVDLDLLEVEQRDEGVEGRDHPGSQAEPAQRSRTCPAVTSSVRVVRTASSSRRSWLTSSSVPS